MMWFKRSSRLLIAAALVPAVFACELLLPEHTTLHLGLGEALGCSGSGNAPRTQGWTWLKPFLRPDRDVAPLPVATDGFFVIEANVTALSSTEALASLTVVVKDGSGATPGPTLFDVASEATVPPESPDVQAAAAGASPEAQER